MTLVNDKKFFWTFIASIVVLIGIHIRYGYKHLNSLNIVPSDLRLGPALTSLGLFLLALSIATKSSSNTSLFDLQTHGHAVLVMLAIGLILVMGLKLDEHHIPDHTVVSYASGWALLALALAAQSKFDWLNTSLAFGGALMILFSNLNVLPNQRKSNHIDGPGYTMITCGLLAIVYANSLL